MSDAKRPEKTSVPAGGQAAAPPPVLAAAQKVGKDTVLAGEASGNAIPAPTGAPGRVNIFDVSFSCVDLDSAAEYLLSQRFDPAGYVCFPCTASLANAHGNEPLVNILNAAVLTLADGKFTEFYARAKGHDGVRNVSGYWLMDRLLRTDRTHYFYGSDQPTLDRLREELSRNYPEARILGYRPAPFLEAEQIPGNEDVARDMEEIRRADPDFVWVSLSHPKQEILMHYFSGMLGHGVMLGVGAVFLYHAGIVDKGPEILKKLALRWAYRLLQQPGAVLKRNHVIPGMLRFLGLILRYDVLRMRRTKGK
jgi:N-acetylglucosaminyldiphosphoundecaprenol N-acetyl-beta-D-mannosaminyltransferase